MMLRHVLSDPTARYSATESFVYDRIIAPAVQELQRELGDELRGQIPRGARVLEIGSGGGQLAIDVVRSRPDVSYLGVDLSPEQVARARGRARGLDTLNFTEGSALKLPVADAQYDVVLSVASIKHWPDPALGLRECLRALRPGGHLFIVEVDRGCRLDDAQAFVDRWRLPGPLKHIALPLFRTYVAGHSLDLIDVDELTQGLDITEVELKRIAAAPAWLLQATKTH